MQSDHIVSALDLLDKFNVDPRTARMLMNRFEKRKSRMQ